MEQKKKQYEPPEIGRIIIIPEESLTAAVCKVFAGDTSGPSPPTNCGQGQCKSVGS